MRDLRDVRRGRARRPVALTTAVIIAAMLVPAGAAVADDGTTTTETTTTSTEPVPTEQPVVTEQPAPQQPVADQPAPQQPASQQPVADSPETSSSTTSTTSTDSTDSDSSTVIIDENGDASDNGNDNGPVEIVEDEENGSSGGGTDEAAQMDLSFTFTGLMTGTSTEPYATVGVLIHAYPEGDYPSDATIDISWYVGAKKVAEGTSYTPTTADLGQPIKINWTATAPYYDPHVAGQSVASTTVEGLKKMTGKIAVNGTYDGIAYVDSLLDVTPNAEWPVGAQFSWEWTVGNHTRSNTTYYWPSMLDVNQDIWVDVTVKAPGYETYVTRVQVASNVVYKQEMPRGEVGVIGHADEQATLGKKLTAQPTGWPVGSMLTYQWRVDGDNRATTASYTPVAADLGKFITVTVTATHPDFKPGERQAWVGTVVTTPTVSVGSATVNVGDQAVLPVTVSGPQGGPVPTGVVKVTLAPQAGGSAVDLGSATLDHGVAKFVTDGVPVGIYTVKASYVAKPIQYGYVAASITLDAPHEVNPYVSTTGTGTLTVVAPKVTLTAPAAISTAVATQASFSAMVSAPGKSLPGTWTVRLGNDVVASGETVKGGGIAVTLPVLAIGTHTLVLEVPATKRTAAASTTITLTVTGEPVRTGTTPTEGTVLETPKAATTPGQKMELVATGFQPGETVAFYLHSEPMFLGTAVAGADGVARLLATVPAGAPTGTHTVIATGGTTGRWATLVVDLAVPAVEPVANPVAVPAAVPAAAVVPAATGDLAVTGSQTAPLMIGAWLLLLVGGGLVVATRRVRATR